LQDLERAVDAVRMAGARVLWLETTAVVDTRLQAEDKLMYMTDARVQAYRQAID
jgi:hypothetical protein